MRKIRLLLIMFFVITFSNIRAQKIWIEPNNANVNNEITIFLDKENSNFYTGGEAVVYIHAGVDTDAGAWQNVNNAFSSLNDSQRMTPVNKEKTIWKKTIDAKTYFSLKSGLLVKGINLLFRNQYSGDNDKTGNFYLDLVDKKVEEDKFFEISPAIPKITDEICITFDPSKAAGKLLIDEEKIYMHSWAVCSGLVSKTADYEGQSHWNDNTKGALTKLEDGKWQIKFIPKDYFNITDDNENLFRIGLLFRTEKGDKVQKNEDGEDIYIEANPEFYISVSHPTVEERMVEKNIECSIAFTTSDNANVRVLVNDVELSTKSNVKEFSFKHVFKESGKQIVELIAQNGEIIKSKKVIFNVYNPINEVAIPNWIKANSKGVVYHQGIEARDDDFTKATLILHAPTSVDYADGYGKSYGSQAVTAKKVIYILGDFNNWQVSEEYKMQISPDKNYFWLTLNNLEKGKEYVYQYFIDGKLYLADPYSRKVSNPDDRYISSATYPNLIEYPANKAHGIASILQTGQEVYSWKVNDFKTVSHNDLNVYELHIRDFTKEGSFKAAALKLDYIKKMGINCIHVMPVSEFEGNDSWGYNPNFYFAVDKAYGKASDLKDFIDKAHSMDIAVINDLVLNHSFNTSSFAQMYWDKENNHPEGVNPWYNAEHNFKNPGAHWGSDFNHTSVITQQLVDNILNYWMDEFHFDGFRFDFTKGFSNTVYGAESWGSDYDAQRIGLLKRMVKTMRTGHPNSIAIFEHLASSKEDVELANEGVLMWGGKGVTAPYEQMVMGWSSNNNISNSYFKNQGYAYANLMSYMESHDEERLAYKALRYGKDVNAGDIGNYKEANDEELSKIIPRLKAAAAFNLLLPGPRMIWQFQELAYEYSIEYNGRTGKKPVRWDYLDNDRRKSLYDFYSAVLGLRNKYNLFANDKPQNYVLSGDMKRITLNAEDKDGNGFQIIAIANFGEVTKSIIPYFGTDGKWYEFESNKSIEISNHSSYSIDLQAGELKIYSSRSFVEDKNKTAPVISACSLKELHENQSLSLSTDMFTIEDKDGITDTKYKLSIRNGDHYTVDGQTITLEKTYIGDLKIALFVNDGKFNSEDYNLVLKVLPNNHPLVIKVNDAKMFLGDVLPEFHVSITGFLNGDDINNLTGKLIYTVNEKEIFASGLSSEYYNIEYKSGVLSVEDKNKTAPVISACNLKELHENQSLSLSADMFTIEDKDNVLNPVYTFNIQSNEHYTVEDQTIILDEFYVGDVNITLNVNDGKYDSEYFSFVLKVKAGNHPLLIKVNDVEVAFGESYPDFSSTAEGFVNDNTISDLDGKLVYKLNGNNIIASGLSSEYYNISYQSGILKVNYSNKKITLWPNPAKEEINIKGFKEGDELIIYNISGVIILRQNITEDVLNIGSLSTGIYFLKIGDSRAVRFIKID
ncbi:MAG: alpha-amylase family glycosyl hydrolase [Marinifilaceae bacterium]